MHERNRRRVKESIELFRHESSIHVGEFDNPFTFAQDPRGCIHLLTTGGGLKAFAGSGTQVPRLQLWE
jgi:hypothetical protein